jgi:hypothetical protein
MRPPAPSAEVDVALLSQLRAWSEAGAFPRMTVPLAFATIAPHAGLDGAACAMDGSQALALLNPWEGLAWRAQVLMRDIVPGRALRSEDPWDCGWWREGPMTVASAFKPRRPTLLLVPEHLQSFSEALRAQLQGNSARYSKPLRVLQVSTLATAGMIRLDINPQRERKTQR